MHPMLNPEYTDKDADYPNGFVPVTAYDKPHYNTANVQHYPKKSEGNLTQKQHMQTKFNPRFNAI